MTALPALTVATKGEADAILAHFDGEEGWLSWLASVVRDEVERRAARSAAEQANTAVRDAVDDALTALPTVVAKVEEARGIEAVPVEIGPVEAVDV